MEEEFTKKIGSIVTSGFVSVGLGIGHKHGLWEVMATLDTAITSQQLADLTSCKERYIREWLKWMSCAEIVEVDETGTLYYLPPHHRAGVLSPSLGFSYLMPSLLHHHEQVMAAVTKEGPPGIAPKDCDVFFRTWEATRESTFSRCLPDLVTQLGIHDKLDSGIEVIDLGTSRGHALHWFASRYPRSSFIGVDIGEDCLKDAEKVAAEKGLTNVSFVYGDVTQSLPDDWSDRFDMVLLFDVLHDLPHASKATPELYRICKPDGVLSVVDVYCHSNPKDNVGDPLCSIFPTFSMYFCLSLSLNVAGSEGLGTLVGIEKLTELIEHGGFEFEKKGKTNKIGHYVHLMCVK